MNAVTHLPQLKTFLRLGFRRDGGKAKAHLSVGAKVVTSRIADVSFQPFEVKVDLDRELATKLRDRLNLFLDREDGHIKENVK